MLLHLNLHSDVYQVHKSSIFALEKIILLITFYKIVIKMKIALIGATGLVGSVMLKVLEERGFGACELIPAASSKSVGKVVNFAGREVKVVSVEDAIAQRPAIAVFSAGSGYLASAYGKIYVLSGDRISKVLKVDADHHALSACVIGSVIYYPCGDTVNGYDTTTGEKVCYYKNSFDASLLYHSGNAITVINRLTGNQYSIPIDKFTRIETDSSEASAETNADSGSSNSSDGGGSGNNATEGGNNSGSNGSGSQNGSSISSKVYHVDHRNKIISGIPSGTTFAVFKTNMSYSGYTPALYRGGNLKKSGYVGTAMTVVFTPDSGSSHTFELSVTGDLTGEGKENSRDLNILMDYLIGAADFNGVYTLSADLSGDNTVDIIDAVLMKRET